MDPQYRSRILQLFNEIEMGCGLFKVLNSYEIEFNHLTFQEFLAAKYMVYVDIDWQHFLEKQWWEETLLIYTGLISIDRKRTSNDIVKTILSDKAENETDEKERCRFQLLGARAFCDFQPIKRDKTVVTITRERLIKMMESDVPLEERFRAGVLMGGLGDNRISANNMVLVPAGEFIRITEKYSNKNSVRRIYVDAFMIKVYQLTNMEFKQFIDDKGYHREEFWTPEGWQWCVKRNISKPAYWNEQKFNGPNFPVVGISWYESVAYANWLSKVTGKPYRLPTEAEWEKAAFGNNGNIYPWGNKFDKKLCNSLELNLNSTSPVGIFPKGKSSYGCFDMAGNVWEWCADWHDKKYHKECTQKNPKGPSVGPQRVHRGGSWIDYTVYCASYRSGASLPTRRDNDLGVRLAMPILQL